MSDPVQAFRGSEQVNSGECRNNSLNRGLLWSMMSTNCLLCNISLCIDKYARERWCVLNRPTPKEDKTRSKADSPIKTDDEPVKITRLPYYGGAKGQTLQIIETADGKVTSQIIKTPEENYVTEETSIPSELEYPPLPSKYELEFNENIKNIHRTALNIIKLQELAKKTGKLNEREQTEYETNMESLNLSAKNLAQIQQGDEDGGILDTENREALGSWFERKKTNKKDKDKKKEEEKRKEEEKKKEEEEQKKKEEEELKRKEEEKKKEEKEKEEEGEEEDGVEINVPPQDASVAEAKPIGLAVAGIGGVAASKPIATAVVGPGGLAIARPVGTAIAGVSPEQALVPIYAEGYVLPSKNKGGTKEGNKKQQTSEYLNKIISKYHQV